MENIGEQVFEVTGTQAGFVRVIFCISFLNAHPDPTISTLAEDVLQQAIRSVRDH